ncbi:hypothetical protein ACLB2K_063819 [Fragaria x ananassa]
MTGRQLVTSPESQESSPSTSVNTCMKLLSYLKREKLKVPQKKARQEEEEEDDTEEEEEVEQYLVEMRALEVEEIEKNEKEDEDEDLEKIPHTQQKCTLVTFFKLIESHRDKIPSEAWQLISQTCFGEMINAFRTMRIGADQVGRFELDIEILLRHCCKETKKFLFGEKEMEITEEDVHLLFGLTKEGENDEEKISRRKKSSQQSTIFGKTKGSIFRKMIHDKLTEELNKIKNKEAEPRKIASLIIMYLLATFFFSTSGSQIEWQLVLTCEDLEAINKINWSRKVIEAFHEGVKKHDKGKPKGLNGCVVLPLYCFLERTQIKERIQKKKADIPRFVRWSTNGIIYGSHYLKRPKKLEELVAQGPWKDEEESTSGSEEYGTPDEHGTPSFEEWVPLSSQQEVEENRRVGDNFKTLLTDLEEEIPEDLNEKLKEISKANEELQSRVNDYVHKLQLADDKIKQLEMEKRAQDSLIKALKRKLKKAKSSANGPPEQKRQFGGEEYGCQGDEQTEGNENQNRSLIVKFKVGTAQTTQSADDQPEALAVIHDEQPLNHVSPVIDYEDLPLTDDDIFNLDKIVESQAASIRQSATEKDNVISATVQSQVSSIKQTATTEDKKMNTYSKKRKAMEPMSIEKNVKLNPRNAKKTKDPDWEYGTPKDIQVHKKIIIKNLKCDNSTWDSLGDDLKMHYKQWFEARPNKNEDEAYWTCPEGWHCLSKSDLQRIIEQSDILSSSMQVYMRLLKERTEAAKLPVGFMNMEIVKDVIEHETMLELHKQSGGATGDFKSGYEQSMEQNFYNPLWTLFGKQMVFIPLHHGSSLHYTLLLIDNINKCFYHMNSLLPKPYKEKDNYHFKNAKAVVKHIKEFIKRIHYTTVFTLSQDLDQNEYREDYAIDYAPEDSQGRKKSNIVKMTDDEKVTRRWIIDNNIHNKPYKLTEHRTCPQQNVSSSDCGPFVLHYMEAMCAGLDPNQEGGNQMRKKMLEEFAKLN